MPNVLLSPKQVADMAAKLPIDEANVPLYERLLDLPHNLFHPLFTRLLTGEIGIDDFVPVVQLHNLEGSSAPHAEVDLKASLKAKARGERHFRDDPDGASDRRYELWRRLVLDQFSETEPDRTADAEAHSRIYVQPSAKVVSALYGDSGRGSASERKSRQLAGYDMLMGA